MSYDEQDIINRWLDPAFGLVSAPSFQKKLKKIGIEIRLEEVNRIINSIETQQLHHNPVKRRQFNKMIPVDGEYQCDLTFYTQYKGNNNQRDVLLCVIHSTFKKAYVAALTNKSGATVTSAMKEIIKKTPDMRVLVSDHGSEFINENFRKLLLDRDDEDNDNEIELKLVEKKHHTAIVERFNRTLRTRIEKYLTSTDSTRYIDVLQDLVENYNNTPHRALNNHTPNEVTNNPFLLFDETEAPPRLQQTKFEVGDTVRLIKPKKQFEKTGERYYRGTYKITKVNQNSYTIKNKQGDELKENHPQSSLQKIETVKHKTKGNLPREKRHLRKVNKSNTKRKRLAHWDEESDEEPIARTRSQTAKAKSTKAKTKTKKKKKRKNDLDTWDNVANLVTTRLRSQN